MANKVKFGLSNVHYALMQVAIDGTVSYATPKRLPGAVNLTLDPAGEMNPFYADNVTYYSSSTNNGYTGNLQIADMTREFQVDVLGFLEDANGALIEQKGAPVKPFALMYEVEGDLQPRKAVLYNCVAARPNNSAATEEATATPQTDTLNLTATPRTDNKYVKAVIEKSETNETVFNAFYDAVYEPAIA